MRDSNVTSMLPPHTSTAVRIPGDSVVRRCSSAARPVAPAPSASVFSRSSRTRMAAAISSSSTVTISSTYFCTSGSVFDPARRTAMPSLMVVAASIVTGAPASSAACMLGRRDVCTPTTRTSGFRDLMAQAMPPMSPPPPTGTTTASKPSTCSNISSPMVPCPAITSASLKGWIKVEPSTSHRRMASA